MLKSKDVSRVTLFTNEHCTLCEEMKDVLRASHDIFPHVLEEVNIDERPEYFERYHLDIPVRRLCSRRRRTIQKTDSTHQVLPCKQRKQEFWSNFRKSWVVGKQRCCSAVNLMPERIVI